MATINVIKKTPNLDKLRIRLQNPQVGLKEAAQYVASTARKNWAQSKGLDGKPFKALTEAYKERKSSGAINGQVNTSSSPDMLLTGKMIANFGIEPVSKNVYKVGWGNNKEQRKANGNQNKRPGMLAVTKKVASQATKTFNEWLKK
jgi:hypothetical protein